MDLPAKAVFDLDGLFSGLTFEQIKFLSAYLDADNPRTFMRYGPSAQAAGRKSDWGARQKCALEPRIRAFLADAGLDETSLRSKLASLLHGRESKIQVVQGSVEPWAVHPNVTVIGEFTREKAVGKGENAEVIQETVTVLAIDQEAPELQRKALDMALKLDGHYAPEKVEVPGLEKLLAAVAAKSKDLLSD